MQCVQVRCQVGLQQDSKLTISTTASSLSVHKLCFARVLLVTPLFAARAHHLQHMHLLFEEQHVVEALIIEKGQLPFLAVCSDCSAPMQGQQPLRLAH